MGIKCTKKYMLEIHKKMDMRLVIISLCILKAIFVEKVFPDNGRSRTKDLIRAKGSAVMTDRIKM